MTACSSEGTQEVPEASVCDHDWDLTQERPTCKLCSEERYGTVKEAVQYLWKDDVELGNGSTITMTNTDDQIELTLRYPQVGSNTMRDVVSLTIQVYTQQGYLDSDLKKSIDGFYDLYLSDAAVSLMTETFTYFRKYCGNNLKRFTGEIYYGSEQLGKYVNGTETFNLFDDGLKNYGYRHD